MRASIAIVVVSLSGAAYAQVPADPDAPDEPPPFDAELGVAAPNERPPVLETLARRESTLRLHLEYVGAQARSQRHMAGALMGIVGAGTLGMATLLPEEQRTLALIPAGACFGISALMFLVPDEQERFALDFAGATPAAEDEARRLARIESFERKFASAADFARAFRHIGGIVSIAGGLVLGAVAAIGDPGHAPWRVGTGLVFAASGVYLIALHEYAVERSWRFYVEDAALDGRPSGAEVSPSVGITRHGTALVALSGRF